jgi:hypothetical protein
LDLGAGCRGRQERGSAGNGARNGINGKVPTSGWLFPADQRYPGTPPMVKPLSADVSYPYWSSESSYDYYAVGYNTKVHFRTITSTTTATIIMPTTDYRNIDYRQLDSRNAITRSYNYPYLPPFPTPAQPCHASRSSHSIGGASSSQDNAGAELYLRTVKYCTVQ